jgi:hypothetical protein
MVMWSHRLAAVLFVLTCSGCSSAPRAADWTPRLDLTDTVHAQTRNGSNGVCALPIVNGKQFPATAYEVQLSLQTPTRVSPTEIDIAVGRPPEDLAGASQYARTIEQHYAARGFDANTTVVFVAPNGDRFPAQGSDGILANPELPARDDRQGATENEFISGVVGDTNFDCKPVAILTQTAASSRADSTQDAYFWQNLVAGNPFSNPSGTPFFGNVFFEGDDWRNATSTRPDEVLAWANQPSGGAASGPPDPNASQPRRLTLVYTQMITLFVMGETSGRVGPWGDLSVNELTEVDFVTGLPRYLTDWTTFNGWTLPASNSINGNIPVAIHYPGQGGGMTAH